MLVVSAVPKRRARGNQGGDIIQVSVLGQGSGARGFNIKKLIGSTTGKKEMKEDDQEFFNSVFNDVKQVLGSEQVNFKAW